MSEASKLRIGLTKEDRSKTMSDRAKIKWSKISKEEKTNHALKMLKIRWKK